MLRILVPVDGSENATRVVEFVIMLAAKLKETDIHLITVRDPMDSLEAHRLRTDEQIRLFNQQAGESTLASGRKLLKEAGVPYTANILIGEVAQTIADYAKVQHCDMIIMGTRGVGTISGFLMGSVASKVVPLASIPVTLVR
mgnify:CR=1 FL=1